MSFLACSGYEISRTICIGVHRAFDLLWLWGKDKETLAGRAKYHTSMDGAILFLDTVVRRKRKRCSCDTCFVCYGDSMPAGEHESAQYIQEWTDDLGLWHFPDAYTYLPPQSRIDSAGSVPRRDLETVRISGTPDKPKPSQTFPPSKSSTERELVTVDSFIKQYTSAKRMKAKRLRFVDLANQDKLPGCSSEASNGKSLQLRPSVIQKSSCLASSSKTAEFISPLSSPIRNKPQRQGTKKTVRSRPLAQRLVEAVVMTHGEPSDELLQKTRKEEANNTRRPLIFVPQSAATLSGSKSCTRTRPRKRTLIDARKTTPFRASVFHTGNKKLTNETPRSYERIASQALRALPGDELQQHMDQLSSSPCARKRRGEENIWVSEPLPLKMVAAPLSGARATPRLNKKMSKKVAATVSHVPTKVKFGHRRKTAPTKATVASTSATRQYISVYRRPLDFVAVPAQIRKTTQPTPIVPAAAPSINCPPMNVIIPTDTAKAPAKPMFEPFTSTSLHQPPKVPVFTNPTNPQSTISPLPPSSTISSGLSSEQHVKCSSTIISVDASQEPTTTNTKNPTSLNKPNAGRLPTTANDSIHTKSSSSPGSRVESQKPLRPLGSFFDEFCETGRQVLIRQRSDEEARQKVERRKSNSVPTSNKAIKAFIRNSVQKHPSTTVPSSTRSSNV
ncbi:hypothetical protein AMATHDRAFT_49913 [Amanita thiersii Skay4041]|uniref:Uncharacterized protein n=1 Tax=Amanita thiersii Skay4041 TaxID=703135 RepID=A0A2A9NF62_9AGAR|nr:hypothetical protein AMATHDRAFT_49913 [Amanita thiersii Skay4041]